jgi:hypothetical protein
MMKTSTKSDHEAWARSLRTIERSLGIALHEVEAMRGTSNRASVRLRSALADANRLKSELDGAYWKLAETRGIELRLDNNLYYAAPSTAPDEEKVAASGAVESLKEARALAVALWADGMTKLRLASPPYRQICRLGKAIDRAHREVTDEPFEVAVGWG